MLFNSLAFLVLFLPVTVLAFYGLGRYGGSVGGETRQARAAAFLTLASLFFYGFWDYRYLVLLIASVALNRALGKRLMRARSAAWLGAGVLLNLSSLACFKYADFLLDNWAWLTNATVTPLSLALPLGISFFTFQQIAYLVECKRGTVTDRGALNYALFVVFFPQLIAGPIVRFGEISPQFAGKRFGRASWPAIATGLALFALGLSKKVLLADPLSSFATPVFDKASWLIPLTAVEAWVGALAYSFQIYFDFSGYSDMAIGLGSMLGLRLPQNFNSPYRAHNVIEFWRRWHVTLSTFLRDYLYVPLGGNRMGRVRRYVNLMIVMLVGGLWHGAGWNFVLWGGIHGALLGVNHGHARLRRALGVSVLRTRGLSVAITFLVVVCAWVVFRAPTLQGAGNLLGAMFGLNVMGVATDASATYASRALLERSSSWLVACGIIIWALPNSNVLAEQLRQRLSADDESPSLAAAPMAALLPKAVLVGLLAAGSVFVVFSGAHSEFIYFQF